MLYLYYVSGAYSMPWRVTNRDMDTQSSLSPSLARRIDKSYSAIRRTKRMAEIAIRCNFYTGKSRNRDRYFQLLGVMRRQADNFSDLILGALKDLGYTSSWEHSNSNYIMIDTEIHVYIDGYTFRVWSFNHQQYGIVIEDYSYYDYPLESHPCSSGVIDTPVYTVQKLIDNLTTIRTIFSAYKQCSTCHYGAENEYYCGRGLTPMGSCSHYRPSSKDHDDDEV